MLPRPRRIQNDRIFHLEEDRLIEPSENGSWVRVREEPSPADAKALRAYTKRFGENVVVELAAKVPLSALAHAEGAAFAISRKPFFRLRGKLKRGYFHLRSPKESRALMDHLGVPQDRLDAHEPALFDF